MTLIGDMKRKLERKYKKVIDFPRNDIDAYEKYNEYVAFYNGNKINLTALYSRLFIMQLQNIKAMPLPIYPDKYPVIIKPIINLYGMGNEACKINNQKEFDKKWLNTGFWSECFEGDHYSIDLVFLNNKLITFYAFKGYKLNQFGCFDYWEFAKKYKLDNNNIRIIQNIIENTTPEFSGIINLEVIGNYIIEVHLRMGDCDILNNNVLEQLILLYDLNKINVAKLEQKNEVYLVPIWFNNFKTCKNNKKVYIYLKEKWIDKVDKDKKINDYYFDKYDHSSPESLRRWILLISNNKEYSFNLRDKIQYDLKTKFKL